MINNGSPPAAEFDVDRALVRRLVAAQAPEHGSATIGEVHAGWDNFTVRIGPEMAARIPRRALAVPLIRNEQDHLPALASRLPLPVPAPLVAGFPTYSHPRRWSLVPWFGGTRAFDDPLSDSGLNQLGRFLHHLHRIPVDGTPPTNPYRGGPLAPGAELRAQRLTRIAERLDRDTVDRLTASLEDAYSRPLAPPTWIHGDLHGKNIITEGGTPVAVIDWGDLTIGDPATDLAVGWAVAPNDRRVAFWEGYGPIPEDTMARARGWACHLALAMWESHHAAEPDFAEAALTTLHQIADEDRY